MELILGILAIVLVIYVITLFITYVVAPVLSIVGIAGAAAGSGIALFMYVRAALEYMNPYELPKKVYSRTESDVYVYRGKKEEENVVRRSYFFGPGFYSLYKTWITSWLYNWTVVKAYWDWMNDKRDGIVTDWLRWTVTVIFWTGLIAVGGAVLLVGGIVSIGIGLLHAVIMLAVMCVVYLIFSILYGIDHFYLWRHSISSICPRCKQRFLVPVFKCSNCERKHKRLIPSPYGIWTHRCKCGAVLPATFFNGRSRLESFCPYCEDERIASSSSVQFCISLVGGSSSGKTSLLASYLHVLMNRLRAEGLQAEIPDECRRKMNRLRKAYENAEGMTGTQRADYTDPYSLLVSGNDMAFSRQFNIFDVAGETFESPDLGGITYGQDFADSEGLAILVDPLASASLRENVRNRGASVATASTFDPAVVVNNLANYLRQTATKTGQRITRPTAVILTKTDLPVIEEAISSERLEQEIGRYPGDRMNIRDQLCRAFLEQNGFQTLLMALDANFSRVHFFALTATGGAKPGDSYHEDPLLEEPFDWLIASCDRELAEAMHIPVPEKKNQQ